MNIIDQNNALIAQETALFSDTSLIDGRTEIDRLAFLSNFAEVINFYDHENKVNGNWRPFLLKDPAILLAHIAKTRISDYYKLYHDICTKIEFLLDEDKISKDLVINVNHLFNELTKLFVMLERWTYYMQITTSEYELKKYTCHQVKHIYSKYFWALLSLRENLSLINYRYKIEKVKYYLYANFDKIIWKQHMDKSPYWDILGLNHKIDANTAPADVYQAIKRAGDMLFSFLEAIVVAAPKTYETAKTIKSKYPDTLLLRAFVSLLGNYNDQLNGITEKHLQFYYHDILKQTQKGAVADETLLFAGLSKPDETFMLPQGALFNGGFDTQKKPILFETMTAINLNPATITAAYTLAKVPSSGNLTPLQKITDPTTVQKDVDGRVKSWKFFGDNTVQPIAQTKVGLAISSPLLLLREGQRIITIQTPMFDFSSYSSEIKLYLSTSNAWFLVPANAISFTQHNLVVTLQPSDPVIIVFLNNPEKLAADWPMLKIEFDEALSFKKVMKQLGPVNLQVSVSGMKNLQFYNDFGSVSTKNPFELFGPTPLLNSSFMMGSDEIFSKPLAAFNIEIDWNNLPDRNFDNYYHMYNKYLAGQLVYRGLLTRLKDKFSKKEIVENKFFHNKSFTCEIQLLQDGEWKSLNMFPYPNILKTEGSDEGENYPLINQDLYLFRGTDEVLDKVSSQFYFHPLLNYPAKEADPTKSNPSLQKLPQFKYTVDSTSGFVKIVLGGNINGFGSGIYPNVVAQIATYNGWMISKGQSMTCLAHMAELPFSPKASAFIANYTAKTSLTSDSLYPFQAYTYSPFSSQPFNFATNNTANNSVLGTAVTDPAAPILTNDLLLSAANSGFLFLEINQLVPSESVSFYFGLTTESVGFKNGAGQVNYYYLNEQGWNKLAVVADGTANFNCSGIVSIAIPSTIAPAVFIGKDKKYWICISAGADADSFPSITLLKTNGFMARRSSGGVSTNALPATSIAKVQQLTPQIATVNQPFPSFGGIAAENSQQFSQRVSLRLKTKDKVVTGADYFREIKNNFQTIYYTKVVYDKRSRINHVYVVPSYTDWQDVNAFSPLANLSMLNKISEFLAGRSSGLTTLAVSNFNLFSVTITANVLVESGFTCDGINKAINQAINFFLSPWIEGDVPKITIDQGLQSAWLTTLIKNISGVKDVSNVAFQPPLPTNEGMLIVSSMNHQINCNY